MRRGNARHQQQLRLKFPAQFYKRFTESSQMRGPFLQHAMEKAVDPDVGALGCAHVKQSGFQPQLTGRRQQVRADMLFFRIPDNQQFFYQGVFRGCSSRSDEVQTKLMSSSRIPT